MIFIQIHAMQAPWHEGILGSGYSWNLMLCSQEGLWTLALLTQVSWLQDQGAVPLEFTQSLQDQQPGKRPGSRHKDVFETVVDECIS